ncbi:biotin/lipoate A/B protein ligase family protein [Chamaesiphon sp. OTE_20_metabat_361]|uniref:lipoate--protein ligase family protein n=1 Tax=Chamaesiphon sp. OTE_20_metabat_361 TaxID=2964689 RepID=UPI00286C70C0|nr:biotin/lipoate A/B protein ligase family protein [Chamaesiphon sp. OTE_20_metabat_361]
MTNSNTIWRLIPPIETTGTMQMQIDRWLLEQHILGQIPPTLRFYTWSQPTISIGYHQRHYPEHWRSLAWHVPIDIVKRPTGGRGVLHQGDLTYALIGSGFVGKRVDVYQQICQFLIDGWRSIGVDLQYGTAGTGYIHNPNCFGTATSADLICTDGYKLIGSAQLIKSGAILQHGSMRLHPDLDLFEKVFGESISLPLASIVQLSMPIIVDTLTQAARQHFQVEFEIEPLSDREWAHIRKDASDLSSVGALSCGVTHPNED